MTGQEGGNDARVWLGGPERGNSVNSVDDPVTRRPLSDPLCQPLSPCINLPIPAPHECTKPYLGSTSKARQQPVANPEALNPEPHAFVSLERAWSRQAILLHKPRDKLQLAIHRQTDSLPSIAPQATTSTSANADLSDGWGVEVIPKPTARVGRKQDWGASTDQPGKQAQRERKKKKKEKEEKKQRAPRLPYVNMQTDGIHQMEVLRDALQETGALEISIEKRRALEAEGKAAIKTRKQRGPEGNGLNGFFGGHGTRGTCNLDLNGKLGVMGTEGNKYLEVTGHGPGWVIGGTWDLGLNGTSEEWDQRDVRPGLEWEAGGNGTWGSSVLGGKMYLEFTGHRLEWDIGGMGPGGHAAWA
eukprot:gene23721-9272_t